MTNTNDPTTPPAPPIQPIPRGRAPRGPQGGRLITWRGHTMNLTDWAKALQIPYATLHNRVDQWRDLDRAFTTPYQPQVGRTAPTADRPSPRRVPPNARTLTYRGQTRTIRQWAAVTGLSVGVIYGRLKAGQTDAQALAVLRVSPPPAGADPVADAVPPHGPVHATGHDAPEAPEAHQ